MNVDQAIHLMGLATLYSKVGTTISGAKDYIFML